MQTDLIKRGEVLKIINENRGNFNQMEEEIMKLECAYDVERVVAKLEQQAEQYKRRALELVEKSTNAGIHNKGKSLSYEHAIEIVRNGGKE